MQIKKKWECYETNPKEVEEIQKKYGLSKLVATILVNRCITQEEEIRKFLQPTRNDFHDPFVLPDMKQAVDRIIKAVHSIPQEKIIIYGDYDVDGITSITVLKKFLEERGIVADYYIPNRLEEGYGLNKEAIEKIASKDYSLIITVDCGITSIEEVELAKEKGIDVVITDHHEVGETLPKALAVVDAKRKDNQYGFTQLAGVGVVFKLIQAISIQLGLEAKEYLKFLDIVCVGTISDIVPLLDENRVITKLGLKLVEQTKNIGLKILLQVSGYTRVDATTISFGIAPRINACGRLGHAEEAIKLLLTTDEQEARVIANQLNEYNKQRQDTEKEIFEQAVQMVEKEAPVIILGSENWHHGVIGIVASKITDRFFKPSILVCFEKEEDGNIIGKGSGRSILGFDLHEALMHCSPYLEKYGGHAMAVGVTLKKENFENFKKEFEKYAQESHICDIIPMIQIDEEVTLKESDQKAVKELRLLEPFGEANTEPIFLYRNVKIDSIRTLSEGKHIKLTIKEGTYKIDVIGFQKGELANEYKIGDKVDILGTLAINQFNGAEKVQITLKEIMRSL